MQLIATIFVELVILFFLSRHITNIIYTLMVILLRSQTVARHLITLLYIPGTAIHELAHLFTAEILRVPTGKLTIMPLVEKTGRETEVRLGSVQVAETDPIRRYLIGFAPVFVGMFFLSLLIWLFQHYLPQITQPPLKIGFGLLIAYLLFSISNNMFSSKKDLEGFIFFAPILILIIALFYFLGIHISLTGKSLEFTMQILQGLAQALGIVIGINIAFLLLNGILLRSLLHLNGRQ